MSNIDYGILELTIQYLPEDGFNVKSFSEKINVNSSDLMQIFNGDKLPDKLAAYIQSMLQRHCPKAWQYATIG